MLLLPTDSPSNASGRSQLFSLGWPIAHHVFDGSLRDSETVETVLKDIQKRFGLRRVILVSSRNSPKPESTGRFNFV
jgi:hypothetical protein